MADKNYCYKIDNLYNYFDFEEHEIIIDSYIVHNSLIIEYEDLITAASGRYVVNIDDLKDRDDFNEIINLYEVI